MQGPRISVLCSNHDSNRVRNRHECRFCCRDRGNVAGNTCNNLLIDGLIVIMYPIVINVYFVLDTEGM